MDTDVLDEGEELLEDIAEFQVELSEDDANFVDDLIRKVLLFAQQLCDYEMYDYQYEFAYRIVESIIINDGEEVTALFSRQSGKSQTIAAVIAAVMVLFPPLAKSFALLKKFEKGVMVGVFAPVDDQAATLWSRVVGFLTSNTGIAILMDPEIDDTPSKGREGRAPMLTLRKSGSFCRQQTANPRAKIESKSYHLICVDEAQDADEFTVRKSIHPMGAFYNATIVKTGTPNRVKGDFYKAIAHNKRRQVKRGARQNHFEYNWRACARSNPNYKRFVEKEMQRLGQDSDEFQLAFEIRWLLDRGMLITEQRLDELGDTSMTIVPSWTLSPVVVGIDPARDVDSTVVTVVYVDWDRPDEFGFYEHRILNWLELRGDQWEEQYFQIKEFLRYYYVGAIGVDAQGVGSAVADRLQRLFPGIPVVPMGSTRPDQTERWSHLMQLLDRYKMIYPAHSKARRLRIWKRFYQQMTDVEKRFQGAHIIVEAPEDDSDAHDDFVDSLAIACALTKLEQLPEIEVTENVLYRR
jgi:hypothetical protein